MSILTTMYSEYCRVNPAFRKFTRRGMYQFLARHYRRQDWTFMNYGYASLEPQCAVLSLDKEDEPNRYSIQLYHHVANAAPLMGKDVLEVGSGRGGGSSYIHSYLGTRTMVGLDFSSQAVDFCRRTHCLEGLSFVAGDAECLPFADDRFDVVVNVESAHCYSSMDAFMAQVRRVLRPGGHFLCADFRASAHVDELYEQLNRSGLTMIQDEDITANVVKARDLDHSQRMVFIRNRAPRWLVQPISEFGGLKGSRIYEEFRTREVVYKRFALQKPVE
jgi:ubiquinone/menaquinone biosynthesis C-methylase UbiE